MNTLPPYDLVIGLDRSDQKADLCLIDTRTGERRAEVIATTPEALWEWLRALLVLPKNSAEIPWRIEP